MNFGDDNGILQGALNGGQPLQGRRRSRYRNYYEEEQPQAQPQEWAPEQPPQPPPQPQNRVTSSAIARNRPYSYSGQQQQPGGGDLSDQMAGQRWNQGGGAINQLYGGSRAQHRQLGLSQGQNMDWMDDQAKQKPPNQYLNATPAGQQSQPSFGQPFSSTPGMPVAQGAPPQSQGGAPPQGGGEGTRAWRGFTNAGGQWGGGQYNPNAIQQGDYTGQLEGFNLDKLNESHEDANTLKYVFAKAASGVDVKQPGASQAVVDRLRAMGVNASVENPDGEADRIIFHDTGESIDVMRGGANVGQDGWQWIDAQYGGQPAEGDPSQMPMNATQQALAGQAQPGVGGAQGSDYVTQALAELMQTNPQLAEYLRSIGVGVGNA